jgi:hypothetical protein
MKKREVYVERRPEGDYAVRQPGSERASGGGTHTSEGHSEGAPAQSGGGESCRMRSHHVKGQA